MQEITKTPTPRTLYVLLQKGNGPCLAVHVDARSLSYTIASVLIVAAVSILGTLLFFRELEINRRLEGRILELETHQKMATALSLPYRPLVGAASPPAAAPVVEPKPARTLTGEAAISETSGASERANASVPADPKPTKITVDKSNFGTPARIHELSADCTELECTAKLSLLPASAGVAEGQLLLILEVELPRIGTANPASTTRKKFFVYPGNLSVDELSDKALLALERKPFRFSRALLTKPQFQVTKGMRPIAINAYLFDKDEKPVTQDRKDIENEEPHD